MRALRFLPATALWLAAAAPSQVIISEINFSTSTSPTQWIELTNIGTSDVDLSTWSLYQATKTPFRADNYWFGFPAGTKIQSGAFLRVHWLAPVQASTATDVYTGSTVYHFLFGYLAEPLDRIGGALALFTTQQNALMNMPSVIADWVSWGSSGFPREANAVANGRWLAGTFVDAPVLDDSIALDYGRNAEPTPKRAFFHDASPTPLAPNHPGAAASNFGTGCSLGSLSALALRSVSVPTQGNRDFALRIDGTSSSGILVLVMSAAQGSGTLMFGPCTVWIDVSGPVANIGVPAAAGSTTVPVSLLPANLAGGTIYVQAIQLETGFDAGFSDGLMVTLGS